MKKSIPVTLCLLFLITSSFAQNIPNRGFEEWEERSLYERPVGWFTSNDMAYFGGGELANVSKTEESFSGQYALKLETIVHGDDTLFGYAVAGGIITGGPGVRDLEYVGGFPFTEKPDSLIGYFKYNIQDNDTAFLIITFLKEGVVLAENYLLLFGVQENYTEIGFKLDTLLEFPDSAFFAVSSSHPDKPAAGSWVIADSLHFSNTTGNIPNGSFELWEILTYKDPVGWESVNWFSVVTGSDISAVPTTDAYSGNFALQMTTVYLKLVDQNVGLITAGDLWIGGFGGGFPYAEVPTRISGHYKFLPVGSDSAQFLLTFSKYNPVAGESEIVADRSFKLAPRPTYGYFENNFSLGDIEIDSINIIILSSHSIFGGPGQAPEGSILFLDDLWLESKCSYADTARLFAFADTTLCTGEDIELDAGADFVSYLWSDNSTQRILTVNATGTYRVEVTDAEGCMIEDSVMVLVEPCTLVPEKALPASLKIYPNPAGNEIIAEFPLDRPSEVEISILNLLGQLLYSEKSSCPAGLLKRRIDLSSYDPGIYFIRIRSGSSEQYVKFIRR